MASDSSTNQQSQAESRISTDTLTDSVPSSEIFAATSEQCLGQKSGLNEEKSKYGKQLRDVSTLSAGTQPENEDMMVITSIRATNVDINLGRLPVGFYATVQHSGRQWRTENNPVSVIADVIEWDGPIPIPSDLSSTICLGVHASFEFQPMLGDGEQLRKLSIPVKHLLDCSANGLPFTFCPADAEIVNPRSSVSVTANRWKRENGDLSVSRDLHPYRSTTESRDPLEDATNQGHTTLSRYRKHMERQDLERSIDHFQRALDICPLDHPCRAAALSNLAAAKFNHRRFDNTDSSFDVPLTLYRNALAARPVRHPDRPFTLIQLSMVLLARFAKRQREDDATQAELLLHEAMGLTSAGSHEKRAVISLLEMRAGRRKSFVKAVAAGGQLSTVQEPASGVTEDPWTLGTSLLLRFRQSGHLADLQQAVPVLEAFIASTPVSDHRYFTGVTNLGVALSYRFNLLGELNDLDRAISSHKDVVHLIPDGHPEKSMCLSNLGLCFFTRFGRTGDLSDLQEATSWQRDAFNLTPDGHPDKPSRLNNLGNALLLRFQRFGERSDLEEARDAADLIPNDHPSKPGCLQNLGKSFSTCFLQVGNLSDLEQAISRQRLAIALTSDGDPEKPGRLDDLATSFLARFECLNELSDLEEAILRQKETVHLTSDGHRDKARRLNALGISFLTRFERLGELDDLEQAISSHKEAVDLSPGGDPNKHGRLANVGRSLKTRYDCLGELKDLEQSILTLKDAVSLISDTHPCKLGELYSLGLSLFTRFKHVGALGDLEEAVSRLNDAVDLTPDHHPNKPRILDTLGISLKARFKRLGVFSDLEQAISRHRNAVDLTLDSHPKKPDRLANLGYCFVTRFRSLGELSDIEQAISIHRDALDLTPSGHPDKSLYLRNLGACLRARFEHAGELRDVEQAISRLKDAVDLTPDDIVKPGRLYTLGMALADRFDCLGELSDLDRAILALKDAVDLIPAGDPEKPQRMHNLGNMFLNRFERIGELSDIEKALSLHRDAAYLIPDGDFNKPRHLINLGSSFLARFKHFGELGDLEQAISKHKDGVALTPDGDPEKPIYLNTLGNSFAARFSRLGELRDIDQAILRHNEAVNLTPDGHSRKPSHLNNLGSSFFARFERLGELHDLEQAISRYTEAVDQMPDGHPDKSASLNNLGNSLASHFQRIGELNDLEQAVSRQEDAVDLTPDGHPDKPGRLHNLGGTLFIRFRRVGEIGDLEKAISRNQAAVDLTPDGHPGKPTYLNSLGSSIGARFDRLGELGDLEEMISRHKDAIDLTPDGHPVKPVSLNNLGNSFFTRFKQFGEPSDLEQAISRLKEAVDLTSDDDPEKSTYIGNLGNIFRARFDCFREPSDLERAISRQKNAIDLTQEGHPNRPARLESLANSFLTQFRHTGELIDLEQAILKYKDAIDLTPEDHPDKPRLLNNLGSSLVTRFERLGELNDLEQAISTQKVAVDLTPEGHPDRPTRLESLAESFYVLSGHLDEPSHISEAAIPLYSQAACASVGRTTDRFRASRKWIARARALQHHTLLRAYSVAISLLPQLAWIGLSLSHRYRELLPAADVVRDAAAAALELGMPETAVEWLEQGRSIVWGELFQLRSSYEELSSAHPDHARRLEKLSVALEHVSSTREQSSSSLPGQAHSAERRVTDTLEQEADRHHRLAIERDKLLHEIRGFPGFERFLLQKEFSQLRASAHSGPVVILNASKSRCDALIVIADKENVIHVPLPKFSFWRSAGLQNMLEVLLRDARDMSHDDREGKRHLRGRMKWESLLSTLWNGVVKPVLDALDITTPGDLSRIFWCPTGPFVFLPIHAAGLYGAQSSEPGNKVSDFVVSSYIPTLSTLLQSPSKSDAVSSSGVCLLAIRQPPSDGQSPLPGVDAELRYIREVIRNSPSAQTTLVESSIGTVEEVLHLLKNADWCHFACHGIQDSARPADSGLCLADGCRLKLSDIITLSRPRGGLAFLSACQTATGDGKLTDEAIHIAAGMLFAGYGGVVGTMWSISDKLAPRVARDVYEQLFRNGSVPDYREAARALHDAVGRLRENSKVTVSFVDWLPFIHVGL